MQLSYNLQFVEFKLLQEGHEEPEILLLHPRVELQVLHPGLMKHLDESNKPHSHSEDM